MKMLSKAGSGDPVTVVIFMRGAVDGMNVVVPYGDPEYYRLRPGIAIAPPGENGGLPLPVGLPIIGGSGQVALDLDGFFGLHPSLAPIEPLYAAGEMAAVHAAGYPEADRSHFSSQLAMEVAGNGGRAAGGWLGRFLAATAHSSDRVVRGISVGMSLDQSLSGATSAVAIADSADYTLHTAHAPAWKAALPPLNADVGFSFSSVQHQVFAALDLLAEAQPAQIATDPAATYPADELGGRLRQTAQYIKADMGVDVITLNSEGWDHHVGENSVLPGNLANLAQGLAALKTDLGEDWGRTVVVLMSEFGRTVDENASGGTDHGRANMMLTLGGPINGGQVYGRWPGLTSGQLDPSGDLAITTDYRTVLAEILSRHMGLAEADLGHVFPGFARPPPLGLVRS